MNLPAMRAVARTSVLSSRKNSKEEFVRVKIIFLRDSRKGSVSNIKPSKHLN